MFIVFVVVAEISLSEINFGSQGNNYQVKNWVSKVCAIYYMYTYFHYFKNKPWMAWYRWVLLGYSVSVIVYNIFLHNNNRLDPTSYNIGFLLIIPMILIYLYDIIYTKPYFNVFKDPYLYLSIGLLVFYTSVFTMLTFLNVLISGANMWFSAYVELLNVGNCFLSLGYLGVALCQKNQNSSTELYSSRL